MVETGVLFIGRGVAYHKTGLHGLLFIHGRPPPASTNYCSSIVNFLQPPPATVHQASTGSCSSTPSRLGCGGLLGVLFIQPPTTFTRPGYCSSTANPPAGVGRTS